MTESTVFADDDFQTTIAPEEDGTSFYEFWTNALPGSFLTLAGVALLFLVACGISKAINYWYERSKLWETGSDMSDHTRELLKARFTVAAFRKTVLGRKAKPVEPMTADDRARKIGKMWLRRASARKLIEKRKQKQQALEQGILLKRQSLLERGMPKDIPISEETMSRETTGTSFKTEASKDFVVVDMAVISEKYGASSDLGRGQVQNSKRFSWQELKIPVIGENALSISSDENEQQTTEADEKSSKSNRNRNKSEDFIDKDTLWSSAAKSGTKSQPQTPLAQEEKRPMSSSKKDETMKNTKRTTAWEKQKSISPEQTTPAPTPRSISEDQMVGTSTNTLRPTTAGKHRPISSGRSRKITAGERQVDKK